MDINDYSKQNQNNNNKDQDSNEQPEIKPSDGNENQGLNEAKVIGEEPKPDFQPVPAQNIPNEANQPDAASLKPEEKPEEKPKEEPHEQAQEPQIGVELKDEANSQEVQPKEEIDVAQYDKPRTLPSQDKPEEEQPLPQYQQVQPPIKQQPLNSATFFAVALLVLFAGFGGGFFGYRFLPDLIKSSSVDADTNQPAQTQNNVSANETDSWPVYKNEKYKYSIQYPETWFSQGTSSAQSDSIDLTDQKPAGSESLKGYKVTISSQDAKGKTLVDWVKDNNTKVNITATPSTIKIGTLDGLQQSVSSPAKGIETYFYINQKIILVTYTAEDSKFDSGKAVYQQILQTIKALS